MHNFISIKFHHSKWALFQLVTPRPTPFIYFNSYTLFLLTPKRFYTFFIVYCTYIFGASPRWERIYSIGPFLKHCLDIRNYICSLARELLYFCMSAYSCTQCTPPPPSPRKKKAGRTLWLKRTAATAVCLLLQHNKP